MRCYESAVVVETIMEMAIVEMVVKAAKATVTVGVITKVEVRPTIIVVGRAGIVIRVVI
jgi:hypothetical protein